MRLRGRNAKTSIIASLVRTIPSVKELHLVGTQSVLADYTAGEDLHLAPKQILCYYQAKAMSSIKPPKYAHNCRMEYIYRQNDVPNQAQIAINNELPAPSADFVVSVALQNEKIVGARCFEKNDTYIVAVLTVPIYLKSEREECRKSLQNQIAQSTGKKALVTFDIDVYAKIKQDMSDLQKDTLYKKVTSRT